MPEEEEVEQEIEQEVPGEAGIIEETGEAMSSEEFARFLQGSSPETGSAPVLDRIENLPSQEEPLTIEQTAADFLAPQREPWEEETPRVENEPAYIAGSENIYLASQTGSNPSVLRPLMNPETSAVPSAFRHEAIPSALSSLPQGVRRAALLDPTMSASGFVAPAGNPAMIEEDLGDRDERKYMGVLK